MKRYLSIITLFLILFTSCEDFLEEKSQDLIIPKTAQDYREFIIGEAYDNKECVIPYLDVMSDDVQELVTSAWLSNEDKTATYGYYAWQEDPEIDYEGVRETDKAWGFYYHRIFTCNVIIDKLENDNTITGSETDIKDVLGEAYFLRAYYYFMLANLYGKPYIKETADTDLCVPINNETSVSEKVFKRESVAKVYSVIEDNITEAIKLLEESDVNKSQYRISKEAAYLLASRIYLYELKYDEAIEYSTKLINLHSNLYNISKGDIIEFISYDNTEIIWSHGKYYMEHHNFSHKGTYKASNELCELYSPNDGRLNAFFQKKYEDYMPRKFSRTSKFYNQAFRVSEAYLNRAEALCKTHEYGEAIKDINELRSYRIEGDYQISAANETEALNLILKERRMELCFEYHRWFDLRRNGRPSINHSYTPVRGSKIKEVYVLEENDPAYTLQIPFYIREVNNSIKLNDRPERIKK